MGKTMGKNMGASTIINTTTTTTKTSKKIPFLVKVDNFISDNNAFGRWVKRVWLKKFRDKLLYNFLAWRYRDDDWVFMNYGYGPNRREKLFPLQKQDVADRYCIEMYRLIAKKVDLRNKFLLEIGCGRGGGASFLARYFKPKKITAIDIAKQAIRFCRNKYKNIGNLSFYTGDAEKLFFLDASFDAVINIESVQGYGDVEKFLAEVRRVLTKNGHFFCATFLPPPELQLLQESIKASGLKIIETTNLTPNVLAALDADNDRKKAMIDKKVDKKLLKDFYEFAGLKGSQHYRNFASGKMLYYSFLCQKI
ncbi:MAG: class I SAM-dependent methyltransferase [Hydrotalea sp.]|nr:class I SAM-dependent methyltransferase [Hydrotalea sp.]